MRGANVRVECVRWLGAVFESPKIARGIVDNDQTENTMRIRFAPYNLSSLLIVSCLFALKHDSSGRFSSSIAPFELIHEQFSQTF